MLKCLFSCGWEVERSSCGTLTVWLWNEPVISLGKLQIIGIHSWILGMMFHFLSRFHQTTGRRRMSTLLTLIISTLLRRQQEYSMKSLFVNLVVLQLSVIVGYFIPEYFRTRIILLILGLFISPKVFYLIW